MTIQSDDFNRSNIAELADSPPAGFDWKSLANGDVTLFAINSSRIVSANGASDVANAKPNADLASVHHACEALIDMTGSGGVWAAHPAVCVRVPSGTTDTFYRAEVRWHFEGGTNNILNLIKRVAGTDDSPLASQTNPFTMTVGVGFTLRLEVSGTGTLTVKVNGSVVMGPIVDSSSPITTGQRVMLRHSNEVGGGNSATFDTFLGEDITPPSETRPRAGMAIVIPR